ncbi:DUF3313 domain-containing protein [Stenotrophomonas sp. MMGLT7]|uniref:DUF3313 domain-containing protein n=1 Tax=Stenotrophomonas sp. MMGLT7 TaxID=2901227 RepID=UPI001E46F516|nr:DUF3313 domain-containing protein [Stenotrophomonas sp. MMGLT7]MCD7099678.1 DUF3313 domain-containing protein [Stenotrophomonas sp. MMGLT7]
MSFKRHAAVLAAVSFAVVAGGCASTRPVPYAGIPSSSQLRPQDDSRGDRTPYAYQSDVDWKRYSRVIVDQASIYEGRDAQFEKISDEDKLMLADYLHEQFAQALASRFSPVTAVQPATVRVNLILTGAKANKRVIGTVMKFDLAGGPYNAVQAARGREGAFSGSASYAVEIYDANTNALLAAYVEKQYPSAINPKSSLGALDASRAGIRKGAKELLERMQ